MKKIILLATLLLICNTGIGFACNVQTDPTCMTQSTVYVFSDYPQTYYPPTTGINIPGGGSAGLGDAPGGSGTANEDVDLGGANTGPSNEDPGSGNGGDSNCGVGVFNSALNDYVISYFPPNTSFVLENPFAGTVMIPGAPEFGSVASFATTTMITCIQGEWKDSRCLSCGSHPALAEDLIIRVATTQDVANYAQTPGYTQSCGTLLLNNPNYEVPLPGCLHMITNP